MKDQSSTMSKKDVTVINKTVVYNGFFNVLMYRLQHRLFSGGWSPILQREVIQRRPIVGVLAYDSRRQQVVLIEQFRVGALDDSTTPWLLEIVAGYIEPGESAETVAHRELKEETNLVAKQLNKIYDYWISPGGSMGHATLFLAEVDATQATGIHGVPNENEDIRTRVVDIKSALNDMEAGRINNGMTLIALQWLALNL